MKSLWNSKIAAQCQGDPLKLRVYTSRLLGQEPSLVLHGGGNTSVKTSIRDIFGEFNEVLCIKGSGWDLATIEEAGFSAVRLNVLQRLATLDTLSDSNMVLAQRCAMLNPNAPNPSVEAILHSIIPFKYVDHSHADAVVAISNTPNGLKRIKDIYGTDVLIVPYVMPGFVLAKKVFDLIQDLDWNTCKGIILLNHGLFTFANNAKDSYENHLKLVTKAQYYIDKQKISLAHTSSPKINLIELARIRQSACHLFKKAIIARINVDPKRSGFSSIRNISSIVSKGTLTPDHVIRIKPFPAFISKHIEKSLHHFVLEYKKYFNQNTNGKLISLDCAPRWALWKNVGTISFGSSIQETLIIEDIIAHTIQAMQWSIAMGGWKPISKRNLFEMEYWELEQAKLKKSDSSKPLQGKIALVTGAASGIGKACVERLIAQGVHVAALDINPIIIKDSLPQQVLAIKCDVTSDDQLRKAIDATILYFGGLDILVSNAGIFTPSLDVARMTAEVWDKNIAINLTSHQRLISHATQYLELGINPTIIIIASKNVAAPGNGASAYSVAKAGLTQLARVAALEMGEKGIRVNVIHPNQVFDTAIWTTDVIVNRARNYKCSVDEYKTNNVLKTTITSHDVADLVCCLASPIFSKTTGAQLPIDGGNDRVI